VSLNSRHKMSWESKPIKNVGTISFHLNHMQTSCIVIGKQ
jgi:hypothetical protein